MAGLLPHCGGQAPWENSVVCVNDLGDYAATSIGADKTSTSSKAELLTMVNGTQPGRLMDSQIMVKLKIVIVMLCHYHTVVVG